MVMSHPVRVNCQPLPFSTCTVTRLLSYKQEEEEEELDNEDLTRVRHTKNTEATTLDIGSKIILLDNSIAYTAEPHDRTIQEMPTTPMT